MKEEEEVEMSIDYDYKLISVAMRVMREEMLTDYGNNLA
jgi:hypothetical protein